MSLERITSQSQQISLHIHPDFSTEVAVDALLLLVVLSVLLLSLSTILLAAIAQQLETGT